MQRRETECRKRGRIEVVEEMDDLLWWVHVILLYVIIMYSYEVSCVALYHVRCLFLTCVWASVLHHYMVSQLPAGLPGLQIQKDKRDSCILSLPHDGDVKVK